jgi:hypothetical protein
MKLLIPLFLVLSIQVGNAKTQKEKPKLTLETILKGEKLAFNQCSNKVCCKTLYNGQKVCQVVCTYYCPAGWLPEY